MVCRPASSVMATNGTPRQILAKITDQRAFHVSPRKSILLAISPSLRSDHDTIENWLSKIHQKAIAESTVGTMNGIRTTARTSALKGMLWLSSSACKKHSLNMNTRATPVYSNVMNTDSQNTESSQSHS